MSQSVFTEVEFWALVALSLVVPVAIYGAMLVRKAISAYTVLGLGLLLVALSAVDIYLLQHVAAAAKLTPSLADDAVFLSELSLALYLLPALFGGIGINLVSHVLVRHLEQAEAKYQRDHPDT
ncbi:hypothetical protein [Caenimonas aquaedulcis]|uniref:hypothetical protein n=1 Tax=Caenimonas aquaedulcis TaxID=2793270 RepID=UPI00338E9573